jgi:hypothetical protein
MGKLVEYTIKHGKLIAKLVGPHSTGYEFDLYAFNELAPMSSSTLNSNFSTTLTTSPRLRSSGTSPAAANPGRRNF